MRTIHRIVGLLAGIAMLTILLITSIEIAAYSNYGWYEKTYLKYNVLSDLEMEMDDVLDVTKEMMKYLRGQRDDLVVETVVNGNTREFFNEREKAHMIDVQNLFIGALWIRRGEILLFVLSVLTLWKTKGEWKSILSKAFIVSLGSFVVITISAGMLFMSDFTKYFTIFHEIFFDNDLWLLDPTTDLLIRMLPEGFFVDMVIRIGMIFLVLMVLFLVISITTLIRSKNKQN